MKYDFTLQFELKDKYEDSSKYANAIEEAGFNDAVVYTGHEGHISIGIVRKATSLGLAIHSVEVEVKSVIPDAKIKNVVFYGTPE